MTPRAVLDTNVIVSGLGWHGPPTTIIDAALDGRLVLVTSPPLLAELRRVLRYPKLAKVIHDAEQLVDLLQDRVLSLCRAAYSLSLTMRPTIGS